MESKLKEREKILFLLSLISILGLLFLSNSLNQEQIKGKIQTISYSNNKVSIFLDDNPLEIVIFTNKILNLKENQEIEIYGKAEVYKNKKQIIAHKIISY